MKIRLVCVLLLALTSTVTHAQLCSKVEPQSPMSVAGTNSERCELVVWVTKDQKLGACVCDKFAAQGSSSDDPAAFKKIIDGRNLELVNDQRLKIKRYRGSNCASLDASESGGRDPMHAPWPYVWGCDVSN